MDLNLTNCKVLITGSTAGIGKGIALCLAKEGCSVFLTGRNQNKLDMTMKELMTFKNVEIQGSICDFTDLVSVADLVKQIEENWGYLDVLVCNVGSGKSVPPLEETPEEWQRVLNQNFFSTVNSIFYFLPLLKQSKVASIILISSICGVEVLGAPIAYSVAKTSVISLTANLARPLGKLGIRINVISPGNILFSGSVWEEKLKQNQEMVNEMLTKEVPLGKFGSVNDIANAVAFLASPNSGFITGANLVIDGGQTRSI